MCGIAGLFVSEVGRPDPRSLIGRMQKELTHRGPDDQGMFVSDQKRCALAHTRLSILDLSVAGHQPMSSPDGRYAITYNGEIYNYLSLRETVGVSREELGCERKGLGVRGEGHEEVRSQRSEVGDQLEAVRRESLVVSRDNAKNAINSKNVPDWQSNSDTEVILRAYTKWGRDCLQRLRGMFAFAIWDEEKQELFLARDSFGIKPLYYYKADGLFVFASEIRALLASGLVPRKLSSGGLASYLQFGSVQDPLTIVDDVQSLLPGHGLVVKRRGNHLHVEESPFPRLFTPDASRLTPNDSTPDRDQAVTQLRHILEDSVCAHLVSDVPVAAFLSGGIDSSAIVALMSRVSGERPRTFNVSFDEEKFSEQSYANLIARKFGTQHQDIRLSASTLLGMLPDAFAAMDQPTMDGINTYVVSKAVRDAGIKVALSGLGGDELFAGYPSFRRATQLNALAKAPSAIRHIAAATGRLFTNGSARHRKFWDLMESDGSPYAAYAISRQLFSPAEIAALMRGGVSGEALAVRRSPDASRFTTNADIVNEVSRYELTGYMSNTLLRDTDQMSMAHALEVRVPFVDREVVNFVTGLPGTWKLDGKRPKPLLLDALGGLLPEEIWRRPKMGFTLPFERWMRSAFQPEIEATLSGSEALAQTGVKADYARSVWQAFKNDSRHQPWSRPWALYVLAKWCELNGVAA